MKTNPLPHGRASLVNVGDVLEENRRLRKQLYRLKQEKASLKKRL